MYILINTILAYDRPKTFVLTTFDKLPKFLADNEYLRGGYRVHFSFKLCMVSLFRLHNGMLLILLI